MRCLVKVINQRKSFEEKLAEKVVEYIALNNNLTNIEIVKAKYGLSIFFINLLKVLIIYTVSLALGVLIESIYLHITFVMFRKFSFGFHFKKSFVCTIISIFFFSIFPLIIKNQTFDIIPLMYVLVGCLLLIISFVKAPATSRSVSRPVIKRNICLTIIFFCYFILGYKYNFIYCNYMCVGLLIANILLLPKIGGSNV